MVSNKFLPYVMIFTGLLIFAWTYYSLGTYNINDPSEYPLRRFPRLAFSLLIISFGLLYACIPHSKLITKLEKENNQMRGFKQWLITMGIVILASPIVLFLLYISFAAEFYLQRFLYHLKFG